MTRFGDYQLAEPVDRLLAQLIDSAVAIVVLVIAGLLAALFSNVSSAISGLIFLVGLLFALFYILCADALKGGQSYGKRAMKICVVDATTGRPCTFLKSLIRNASLSFLGIIDWVFIFMESRQRIGDMLANTIVIRKPQSGFSPRDRY